MKQRLERWRYPRAGQLADLSQAIERFVLPGFAPDEPLVTKQDMIFTLGSCFAENLAHRLNDAGQHVGHILMPEAINSPLANRTCLEYAAQQQPNVHAEHAGYFSSGFLEPLRELLPKAKLVVFTVGVAYNLFRGDQFLLELQREQLRSGDFHVRLTTVDENAMWLGDIVKLLRQFNPQMAVVFTLSPVPLNASFVYESVIAADLLSKSTLRLALAKYLAQNVPGTHYWPAFEVVRWLGPHIEPMFGTDDGEPRHVSTAAVRTIVDLFLKYYVR